MFKHKTYNSYKDSGIPWIGQIPTHWEVEQVKKAFTRKKAYCNTENPVILSLTHQGIKFRDISTNEGQIAASYFKYNPVAKGDILLNPMDLITNAFSAVSDKEGVISPAYVNLRTKEGYFNKYYDYYFKLQYWGLSFFAHGKGVSFENRWTLNNETLMNYFIPVPKYSEQQAIADYLDDKCAKIDKIIETEKDIIEKLKEYKQSLITETITKGLNPSAPMKDSGIPWIGKIPAHWEVLKLKYISKSNQNTLSEQTDPEKIINYIDISSVSESNGIEQSEKFSFAKAPSRARRIVQNGDCIVSTVRTYLKAIAFIDSKFDNYIVSTGFSVLTPTTLLVYNYLYFLLKNHPLISAISAYSTGVNYPAINDSVLMNLKVPVPPQTEQQQLIQFLDDKCAKIEKSISDKEQIIEKLTEYKKSLIYECITGKRKVI